MNMPSLTLGTAVFKLEMLMLIRVMGLRTLDDDSDDEDDNTKGNADATAKVVGNVWGWDLSARRTGKGHNQLSQKNRALKAPTLTMAVRRPRVEPEGLPKSAMGCQSWLSATGAGGN